MDPVAEIRPLVAMITGTCCDSVGGGGVPLFRNLAGQSMLWIRDVLVQIRIRRFVPLSDPNPAFFVCG
jgi:hypothetical protein